MEIKFKPRLLVKLIARFATVSHLVNSNVTLLKKNFHMRHHPMIKESMILRKKEHRIPIFLL